VKLDLKPEFADGGEFTSVGEDEADLVVSETPWVYQSWANNLKKLTIPVLGPNDAPAGYKVRLHFADLRGSDAETTLTARVTGAGDPKDIEVNLAPLSGSGSTPTVVEVAGVQVANTLAIEFVGHTGVPLVSAIEVIRER
jgi:hypothetical protein